MTQLDYLIKFMSIYEKQYNSRLKRYYCTAQERIRTSFPSSDKENGNAVSSETKWNQ